MSASITQSPFPSVAAGDISGVSPYLGLTDTSRSGTQPLPPTCRIPEPSLTQSNFEHLYNPASFPRPGQPSSRHLEKQGSYDGHNVEPLNSSNREAVTWNPRSRHRSATRASSHVTARRWMMRINAIQSANLARPNAACRVSPEYHHGGVTRTDRDQRAPSSTGPPSRPRSVTRRRQRQERDDEQILRDIIRGFRVLWRQGR
ncbi:hypothetical protein VTG60DRAFT_6739 [Thermothelomyces hinnuleus]